MNTTSLLEPRPDRQVIIRDHYLAAAAAASDSLGPATGSCERQGASGLIGPGALVPLVALGLGAALRAQIDAALDYCQPLNTSTARARGDPVGSLLRKRVGVRHSHSVEVVSHVDS